MKKKFYTTIVLAMTVIFLLPACPRRKPKVGLRPDNRAEEMKAYLAIEQNSARDEWQQPARVIEATGVSEGDTVGVVLAGGGYFVMKLAEAVGPKGTVYASDPDETLIEALKSEIEEAGITNVKIILSRPDDPQFPYAAVDAVFVVNAMSYVDLPFAFFDNLRRGLKVGGKIIVIDWRKDSKKGPDKKLRRSRNEMTKMLKGMDLDMAEEHDFLTHQYFLTCKVIRRYGFLTNR